MRLLRCLFPVIIVAGVLAGCATTPEGSSGQTGMDRVSPVRGAELNTRMGVGYLERGEIQIAMEKLQTALRQDPDHVPAHVTLAVIYEQIGDASNAERHLRRASRLAPNDGATRNSHAVFLCRQGRYDAARENFEAAFDDPFYDTPEVAYTNAGQCARRSGDPERAESYLREALEIDPAFPDALYQLAQLYYQQGQAFRARAFLQRYEAASEPDPGALLLGFRIESSLDNHADAGQYASRLENQFSDSGEADTLRGLINNDD